MTKEDIKGKISGIAKDSEKILKENEKLKIELDAALKKRILNLDLKPIEKKNAKNYSLLDYIGFIDKDIVAD